MLQNSDRSFRGFPVMPLLESGSYELRAAEHRLGGGSQHCRRQRISEVWLSARSFTSEMLRMFNEAGYVPLSHG